MKTYNTHQHYTINQNIFPKTFVLAFFILMSTRFSWAQDPVAHARIAANSAKIFQNTLKINANQLKIKSNGMKITKNKMNITKLRNTVKSKLSTTNQLLEEGNKVQGDIYEDIKKYHKQEKEEIDKLLSVNNNIMTSGILKQIRTTYQRISEVKNKGMSNLSSDHISARKIKMFKTGFTSIYDEAKSLYDDYQLVKLNNKLQMSDSDRLTHLKEIKKEMRNLLKLMTYWKNKSDRLTQVSMIVSDENRSLKRLMGK